MSFEAGPSAQLFFLTSLLGWGLVKFFNIVFIKHQESLSCQTNALGAPPLCARPKSDLKTGLVHFLCMALTGPPKSWSGRARAPKCSSLCDCLESDLQRGLVYFLSMVFTGPQKSWPGQTRALKCPPPFAFLRKVIWIRLWCIFSA